MVYAPAKKLYFDPFMLKRRRKRNTTCRKKEARAFRAQASFLSRRRPLSRVELLKAKLSRSLP